MENPLIFIYIDYKLHNKVCLVVIIEINLSFLYRLFFLLVCLFLQNIFIKHKYQMRLMCYIIYDNRVAQKLKVKIWIIINLHNVYRLHQKKNTG